MARDLPGFYFDSEKNRYFPVPKRGAAAGKGIPADGKRPQLSSERDQESLHLRAVEPRVPPPQHSLLQSRELHGATLPDMHFHRQRPFTTRIWESQFRHYAVWSFPDSLKMSPFRNPFRNPLHNESDLLLFIPRIRLQATTSFLNLDLGGIPILLMGDNEGLLLLEKGMKSHNNVNIFAWANATCILKSRNLYSSACLASEGSEGASQRTFGRDKRRAGTDADKGSSLPCPAHEADGNGTSGTEKVGAIGGVVEGSSSDDLEDKDDFRRVGRKRRRRKGRGIWRNSERGLERIDVNVPQEEDRRSEAGEVEAETPKESCAGPEEELECPVQLALPDLIPFRSQVTALRAAERTEALQGEQRFIATTFGDDMHSGSLLLLQTRGDCLDVNQLLLKTYRFDDESIWTGEISGDGQRAVVGGSSSAFRINLESGEKSLLAPSNGSATLAQQFDSTGNLVLSGFRNGAISTVDLRAPPPSLRPLDALPPYGFGVNPPNLSEVDMKGRSFVFSRGARNTWQGATIASHATPFAMGSSVGDIRLLRTDENYLLASAMSGSFVQWDRRSARCPVRCFPGHVNSHTLLKMAVDPREKIVALGGEDRMVRIWSLSSGELLQKVGPLNTPITALEWARPDFHATSWGLWMGGQGLTSGPLLATPL